MMQLNQHLYKRQYKNEETDHFEKLIGKNLRK